MTQPSQTSPTPTPPPTLRRRDNFDGYADALRIARRRLPRSIFNELTHGPDKGVTLQANEEAFDKVAFRPRAATSFANRNLETTVLGRTVSMPVIIAPVGALRIMHPQGALAAAQAGGEAGVITAVGLGCGHPIEAVAAAAKGPLWQQISLPRDKTVIAEAIEKAESLGYDALVITADCAVAPKKRPAFRINVKNAMEFAPELVLRPGWTWRFIRDGLQLQAINAAVAPPKLSGESIATWDDLKWVRSAWKGPLVIKGIVTADDARRAVDIGAEAVAVSNHGGMTLDGTIPTLQALPSVVRAVGTQVEVLVDGGVRRGTDVVKALALGAKAVLIGRSMVMGLAIAGAAGVRKVLEDYRYEIDRTLGLLGVQSVDEVDESCVVVPTDW